MNLPTATEVRRLLDAPRSKPWFQAFEATVGLVLIALGLAHLGLFIRAMTETGLWHDEIVSVELFSSQGLWTTLTTYPAPNNHIFFNALTSILPWSDLYSPAIARFWSFLAMISLALAGSWAFLRRRSFLEAGILIHLLLMSPEFVALNLQARGYGLLALFTLMSGLLAWRHERHPERIDAIAGIGFVSWIGMWTMPSYLLFAAPFMAAVAMTGHRLRNIALGLATGVATLVVYLPVLPDLLASNSTYAEDFGRQLDSAEKIAAALRLYLFHDSSFVRVPNDVAILLLWLALAAFAFRPKGTPESRTAFKLTASAALLIAAAYVMGTPPPRTLIPCLVAYALAAVLVFRDRLKPDTSTVPRTLAALVLAVIIIPHDAKTLRHFDFMPRERWKTIAEFIDGYLPESMPITVPYRAYQLGLYLDANSRMTVKTRKAHLGDGRTALVLSGHDPRVSQRLAKVGPELLSIRFDQNRGGHQTLFFAPPERSLIKRLTLNEIAPRDREMDLSAALDRDLDTRAVTVRSALPDQRYIQLHAELDQALSYQSLFLVFDEEQIIGRVRIKAERTDGSTDSIPPSQISEWGSTVIVDLGEKGTGAKQKASMKSLEISVRPNPIEEERHFSLRELWVYPN